MEACLFGALYSVKGERFEDEAAPPGVQKINCYKRN